MPNSIADWSIAAKVDDISTNQRHLIQTQNKLGLSRAELSKAGVKFKLSYSPTGFKLR